MSRSLSNQAQGATPRRSWGSSIARTLILGSVIGAGCWVGSGDKPYRRMKLLYIIPLRMARNVVTATEMVSGDDISQAQTVVIVAENNI